MKPDHSHDSHGQEPLFDESFRIRDLASPDFASRTLEAVRESERRGRVRRFTAWAGALAASLALFLGLTTWQTQPDPYVAAGADLNSRIPAAPTLVEAAPTRSGLPGSSLTSDELTATLLLAAVSDEENAILYAQVQELELLLEEAIAIADDDSLQTLDMLILLAQN